MKRLLLAALLASGFAHPADRPNIVVFLVDDMGVMDTSLPFLVDGEGKPERHPLNDFYRTPNMERLAAQGIRFSQFYAQSVCSPTRISIMTGQNAARHHCTQYIKPSANNRGRFGPEAWRWEGIAEGEVTLPALLANAGYHTIHVGKAHFGPEEAFAEDPARLGFAANIAGHAWGAPGSYYGSKNFSGKSRARAVPGLEKYHGQEIFLTEALTLEAKAELDPTVEKGQPFYLYLSHYAVHAPFESDPRFAANYVDSGQPRNAQAFATLIEGMDKSLGDLLDHLAKLGVAEDTLVLFLGDNGTDAPLGAVDAIACAAPLRGKKATHYEGGLRVPFIAAWAARDEANPHQRATPIPAGAIQHEQIGAAHEIFPTVLEVAGVEAPADHPTDGSSLRTLLAGKADPAREETFLMHFPHEHRSSYFTSLREGDWKLVYHYPVRPDRQNRDLAKQGGRHQLFHLAEDPSESRNLAADRPDELARMVRALNKRLKEQGALPPTKDGKELRP